MRSFLTKGTLFAGGMFLRFLLLGLGLIPGHGPSGITQGREVGHLWERVSGGN